MIWSVLCMLVWILCLCFVLRTNKSKEDNVIMDAEQARQVRKLSADKEDLDKLLKPILKDIKKAATNGRSEIALFKRDWYTQEKLIYQRAVDSLRAMGYRVERNYSYPMAGSFITISW